MREFECTRTINTLQPHYHLFRRDVERAILPYCQDHGIRVLACGPLALGLLAENFTPRTTFASDNWRSKSPVFHTDLFAQNPAVANQPFAEIEQIMRDVAPAGGPSPEGM